jgi:hypothetical protein
VLDTINAHRHADTGSAEALVPDYDRDSIHTLPLGTVPIQDAGLRKARLIKNVRLETRIELYRESGMGSAQISVDEIPKFFNGDSEHLATDMGILRKLEVLSSFDCYSLRRGLRDAGIQVDSGEGLSLSSAKRRELFPFMRNLTRPLVRYIYGGKHLNVNDTQALLELISNPDQRAVRSRLEGMSEALETTVEDLPNMLEDFGDVFMSLSYYRSYFVYVVPKLDMLVEWMREVSGSPMLRNDTRMQQSFKGIEQVLSFLSKNVTRRFNQFDKSIVIDWDKVTVETFNQVRKLIMIHHESLAQVLCGLTVKVYEWENAFPNRGGSPDRRADFLLAEIRPGLDGLHRIERAAPKF